MTPTPKIVSRDEWLAARAAHLAKEKSLTRLRDQLSAERRALPWERIETNYVDRKSTRLNSSHIQKSRMPSSA